MVYLLFFPVVDGEGGIKIWFGCFNVADVAVCCCCWPAEIVVVIIVGEDYA